MNDNYSVEDLIRYFEYKDKLSGNEYKDIQNASDFIDLLEVTGKFSHSFTDLSKLTYQYVSPSIKHITGHDADEFMKKGWALTLSLYSPEVALIQKAIHTEILKFIENVPLKHKSEYKFRFSSIIKHANGNIIKLMHYIRFLKFSKEGKPMLMFSVAHEISDPAFERKMIFCISRIRNGKEKVIMVKDFYPIFENHILTRKELEVWKLLCDGYSSKNIAEKMKITLNTVLTHRKKINKKLKAYKS